MEAQACNKKTTQVAKLSVSKPVRASTAFKRSLHLLETYKSINPAYLDEDEVREKLLKDYRVDQYISGGLLTTYGAKIYRATEVATGHLFALSVINTGDDFFDPNDRKESAQEEFEYSRRLDNKYILHTKEKIDLPNSRFITLIQELADNDMHRISCPINDQSFRVAVCQCLEISEYCNKQGLQHSEDLVDLLYFKTQGRIKISALEKMRKLRDKTYNSMTLVYKLTNGLAGWSCLSRTKPTWMDNSTYIFSQKLLTGYYPTTSEALKAIELSPYKKMALVLEPRESNHDY